jgi:hypothetical protein
MSSEMRDEEVCMYLRSLCLTRTWCYVGTDLCEEQIPAQQIHKHTTAGQVLRLLCTWTREWTDDYFQSGKDKSLRATKLYHYISPKTGRKLTYFDM